MDANSQEFECFLSVSFWFFFFLEFFFFCWLQRLLLFYSIPKNSHNKHIHILMFEHSKEGKSESKTIVKCIHNQISYIQ